MHSSWASLFPIRISRSNAVLTPVRLAKVAAAALAAAVAWGLVSYALSERDSWALSAKALGKFADTADGVSQNAIDVLLLVAGVGIVAMSIVELLKAVLPLRAWYHFLVVDTWLRRPYRKEAWSELMWLAAGSDSGGMLQKLLWLDQPSSTVHSQMQAAVRIMVHAPEQSPNLSDLLGIHPGQDGSPANDPHLLSILRATRSLEMLRIRLEYWWARANQASAMLISIIVFSQILMQGSGSDTERLARTEVIILSIMGGMVAPFAKDLVTRFAGVKWKRT